MTAAHIGEDGVCEPDCTGCHHPGNGDNCPTYQQGDAEQPCGTCRPCTRCNGDGCDWHLSPTNGVVEIDRACPACKGTGRTPR